MSGTSAPHNTSRHLRKRRGLTAAFAAMISVTLVVPPAWADETSDVDDELAQVRSALAATASTVAEVEVALADQQSRLEQITIGAMVAREDHVDALVLLEEREEEAERAQAQAKSAADKAEEARKNLARVALQAERSGTSLTQIEAFITSDGFDNVVARSEAYTLLGNRISDAEQELRASRLIADTLAERADRSVVIAAEAADTARQALETYEEAENLAQLAVAESENVYNDLIGRMADLRGTSIELEDQRQQQREADRIRREQEALRNQPPPEVTPANSTPVDNPVRPQPSPSPSQSQPSPEPSARPEPTPSQSPSPTPGNTPAPSPSPSPSPSPTQTPSPTPPPAPTPTPSPKPTPAPSQPPAGSSSGTAAQGAKAVSWARNQLGKGYLLGASGPDLFDCSGLTSQSWLKGGGMAIQRSSRQQYQSVKKISYSEMRPGDLIFWGTGDHYSSVYHVAIYAGNNKMIEAVRAGVPVREVAVGSWGASDMMPYAGRP